MDFSSVSRGLSQSVFLPFLVDSNLSCSVNTGVGLPLKFRAKYFCATPEPNGSLYTAS